MKKIKATQKLKSHDKAIQILFEKLGSHIRLATPLGLGKPNVFLNAIYERACADKHCTLDIYTALSLTPPDVKEELGKRFLQPFSERQWGKAYPALNYFLQAANDSIPGHIRVHEFYFQSGAALKSRHLQQNYQSVNYTHVVENIFKNEINVLVQLVSKHKSRDRYSFSCNPDLTLDLVDLYQKKEKELFIVGVVHPELPYLEGESEVPSSFFDLIVDTETKEHELFALPREPISVQDHFIGLHASQLVADGGTLQVGIGSLSEAIGAALVLRHQQNELYKKLILQVQNLNPLPSSLQSLTDVFSQGLYGLSEMVTDVFMHLRKAGVLTREVIDEKSKTKTYLHGAFYLGSKELYQWFRDLSPQEMSGLRMTRVSKVNDLYDPDEILLRQQRVHGRFFNTCMQLSLLGGAISETLASGQVVSGIGGQYNFVSMALELEGSRSILMLRSTYQDKGKIRSNIVWNAGHLSIPRHLRDLVITEYGVADLRGKSDQECIKSLLAVSDSRFQQDLMLKAKQAGKLSMSYEIPENLKNNSPQRLEHFKESAKNIFFKAFPFGSDFTPEEEKIALALQLLKSDSKESKWKVLRKLAQGLGEPGSVYRAELKRMRLESPQGLSERWNQKLLLTYLKNSQQKSSDE